MENNELEYEENPGMGGGNYHFASQHQGALISYLDPNTQRQKLMIQLFGLEWDEKGQVWKQNTPENALIKTTGGRIWLENLIAPFFTVSSTTNRLKHNQIVRMIHSLVDEIAMTIKVKSKRDEYGIEISDINEIGNLVTRTCFLNLNRSSERGIDVNLLNQNTKYVESRNINSQRGGSFLKGLNPLNAFKK